MEWLGLDWDGQTVYQFVRAERHREIAEQMLRDGRAYRCYATQQELDEMRAKQRAEGKPVRYDGRWRDRDPSDAPKDAPFVVRLKAEQQGETIVHDVVQGDVKFANEQLDDMILLRSDGTPTYMLAVVVDDHDMGVTHVIRGDDHLNNTPRQMQIIKAMDWPMPIYGHVPMILGPDGAKLSKRHGALAVEAYRDMGYLPETMRNYLLRLGWSHGNDEIILDRASHRMVQSREHRPQPCPVRFQEARQSERALHPRTAMATRLFDEIEAHLKRAAEPQTLSPSARERLVAAMPDLQRARENDRGTGAVGGIPVRRRAARTRCPCRQDPDAGGARRSWASLFRVLAKADWQAQRLEEIAAQLRRGQRIEARPGGAAHPRGADGQSEHHRPFSACWRSWAGKNPSRD